MSRKNSALIRRSAYNRYEGQLPPYANIGVYPCRSSIGLSISDIISNGSSGLHIASFRGCQKYYLEELCKNHQTAH